MKSSTLAPIALFAYKRADELRQTLQALQANYLASESELYVFVDGAKSAADQFKVEQVQNIAKTVTGFQKIHLHFSDFNKGCANSIISGVSYVLSQHTSVIIVEDDIVTAPNFLNFINQGLTQYVNHPKVFSIGGYTFPFDRPANYSDDVYFYGRTCAWGWGIWADRWFKTDWTIDDFATFISDPTQRKLFNYYGSDRVRMLKRFISGEIDTWDIRLCYNQFKQQKLTAFPTLSKTFNIGFNGNDGTNTNNYNRYGTNIDPGIQRKFNLPNIVEEDEYYTRKLRHKFSVGIRVINRLKTYFFMHK